nr:hypothetical protein [Tanacetum cinerariifolium]
MSNNNILVVKAVGARMKFSNVDKLSSMNLVVKIAKLAEYINIHGWNRPAFSSHDDDDDDDEEEDYTITITPEEPDNSLSMGDEHLDTILPTESDEVIKSSVENLVSIQSEFEGIPDNACDVPFRDNSPPLIVSKYQFEEFSDSNDDSTSIDEDYLSIDNMDYVEASPPDSELVSLEEVEDDNLREKLLNINLLIAKIKSLNDNLTPDHVFKPPSPSSILVEDSNSFLEKSDTSLYYSDNFLPEFESFSNHMEETNSGSTTTHADYSLPTYDSFLFEIEPDQGELTSVVMKDNLAEPRVHVPNVLTTHPTLMLDSDFIPSDNSLPESEIFYFDIKEKNSGSTTIHVDISLSDLEYLNFNSKPDPSELTSIVDYEIRDNVISATNVNLPPEEDHSPLFAYVVWIFLCFLTYLVVPPNLLSYGNEDTIFDPGISNYHFPSFFPDVSHRCETFMKFNVYPKLLNEKKNSGSTTINANISLLDLECFYFKSEPDSGYLTSIVDSGIRENVLSATGVKLSPEDDQSPLFAYVLWIFLPFLTYPVAPPYLLSSRNEDTIFDPGISIYHYFMLGVSHRSGTFIKFNVYPNHLNESSMEILSSTCSPMDQ